MRSSLLGFALVFAFTSVLVACDASVCTRNSDCTSGLVCGDEATCVVPPDLSGPDGGADASVVDQGVAIDLGVGDLADGSSLDATPD